MLIYQNKNYKKSLDRVLKSGKISLVEIDIVIDILASGKKLPIRYKDHALKGDFFGYRECHIRGDVLLLYTIHKKELVLVLIDIGSHSQLGLA